MAVHRSTRGLDLPLAGAPEQSEAERVPCPRVALVAADYPGLKPTLRVQPGDRVLRGQPLLQDKRQPGVLFTAPAAGRIAAVHRGERRALRSVVIDVDDDDSAGAQADLAALGPRPGAKLDRDALRSVLLASGLWTALRTRPYSRIPEPGSAPAALFITATDTQPHAPRPDVVLAQRAEDFDAGLRALDELTDGPLFLCVGAGLDWTAPSGRIRVERFDGPHPAGNVGWHIHRLFPVDGRRVVWHIGYQDVAALGRLLRTGVLDTYRTIALAGPGVVRPRLLRVRLGASLSALTERELRAGPARVISGSVLNGRTVTDETDSYLGRYHLQVCALPPPQQRRLFDGLRAGADRFSATRAFASVLRRGPFAMTVAVHGPRRPMVPAVPYERLLPFDIEPVLLLRALLGADDAQVERLGGLELDEEDLALATWMCPSKSDYGTLLRESLERLREGAA